MAIDAPLAGSNPFSSRFIRPGAIPYLFFDGDTAAQLVRRLEAAHWQGQIVGPHGSGKSTLLASVGEALNEMGRTPHTFSLRDGQRCLPRGWVRQAERSGANLIVLDGYEQLGRLSRWWIRLRCRLHGWGLLITAHDDVGFPLLYRTAASLEVAEAVVDRLWPGARAHWDQAMIADSLSAAGGNLREMLFALYDRCASLPPESDSAECSDLPRISK